jgi:hypothetical protein
MLIPDFLSTSVFTYTRSTGALAPILQAQSDDKTMNAVKASTLASVDDSSAISTNTTTDDGIDKAPSMVKMLMHFTLATNMTQSGGDDDTMTGDAPSMTKRSNIDPVPRQSTDDGMGDDNPSDDATADDSEGTDGKDSSAPPAAAQDFDADDDNSRIFLAPTMLNSGEQGASMACKAK